MKSRTNNLVIIVLMLLWPLPHSYGLTDEEIRAVQQYFLGVASKLTQAGVLEYALPLTEFGRAIQSDPVLSSALKIGTSTSAKAIQDAISVQDLQAGKRTIEIAPTEGDKLRASVEQADRFVEFMTKLSLGPSLPPVAPGPYNALVGAVFDPVELHPLVAVQRIQFSTAREVGGYIKDNLNILQTYMQAFSPSSGQAGDYRDSRFQAIQNKWRVECGGFYSQLAVTAQVFGGGDYSNVEIDDDTKAHFMKIRVTRPYIVLEPIGSGELQRARIPLAFYVTEFNKPFGLFSSSAKASINLRATLLDAQTGRTYTEKSWSGVLNEHSYYDMVDTNAGTIDGIPARSAKGTVIRLTISIKHDDTQAQAWTKTYDLPLPEPAPESLPASLQPSPTITHPTDVNGLAGGTVVPASSLNAGGFEYWVSWRQPGGRAPVSAKLYKRGAIAADFQAFDMKLYSGSPLTGSKYVARVYAGCNDWPNEFYFVFNDGQQDFRAPPSGYFQGPAVACVTGMALGKVWISPDNGFIGGKQISTHFEVKNNGSTIVNGITLQLSVDGTVAGSKQVSGPFFPLNTIESDDYVFYWTPPVIDQQRTYKIRFGVVPLPGEANTGDNWYELNAVVQPPPGSISGYVLDSQGNPIKGATVKIVSGPELGSTQSGIFARTGLTETNPNGFYRIAGLPPGVFSLDVSDSGNIRRLQNVGVHAGAETANQNAQFTANPALKITEPQAGEKHTEPSWSPNGTRIVYETSGAPGIYIVNADGSGTQVRLTGPDKLNGDLGSDEGYDPEWSPDGRWIAFEGRHPFVKEPIHDRVRGVFVAAANGDGTDAKCIVQARNALLPDNPEFVRHPTWSPDSRRIAYVRPDGIWIHDLNSGVSTQLSIALAGELAWSPDGSKIAGSGVILDANSGKILFATAGNTSTEWPQWLRDSSGIAYQKGDDIFVRLLADFDQEIPLLTSEGVQEWTPAISPDGTKLCFSSNQGLGVSPAAALFVTPFSIDRLLIKGFQVAGSTFFTPDGDGTNDVVTVDYQLATDAAVTAKVYASDGNLTRKLLLEARQRAGTNQFVWDGLDEQRRLAKDGIYHLTLDARDSFGNVSFPQIVRVNLAKSFGSLPIGVPSHDGSKFIQGGNERIVIRNLDGTETTVLSLPEKGLRQSERREFDWSPDERQICFVARPSSGAVSEQIYVVNMDRSDRIPLPLTHPDDDGTGNARSVAPAWSPTGKEIAYVSWYIRGTAPDKYLAKNIAVMNSDGTGKRNLTSYGRDNALGYGTVPSWTGDGVNVLYSAREGGEAVQDDIWMVNHNGGQPVQLTDHPFTDIWPFGTIDAGQLIWTSSRQTSLQGSFDLWIQNLDGSAKWALWKNGGGPAVRVSSDGSLIYSGTGAGVIELFQSVTKGRVVGTVAEDEIGKQTKAVAGALVTAYQGSVEIASAVSDLDGTFELLNLAPGTYRLAASRAGYLTVETSLSGVAANASIQLGSPLKTTRLPKARIAKPPVPLRVNRSATLTAELLTRNVQRVDFEWRPKGQQSWASLGSGTAEPFTLTVDVSGRAVGNEETYEARAVARNTDLGLSDDSPETAEIVIDHRSPSSVIVSPTPNQVLPAAAICILQATSHDPDSTGAVFQYRQAGSLTWSDIGSAQGTGFYSLAFNTSQLKVGTTYSLRAVAYDAAGNSDPTPVPVNFSVVEPSASIRLIVSRTAGGVSISWPNSATGFVLEVTDDLNNPNWVPVTGVANNSVTVTISGATKFYRLRR